MKKSTSAVHPRIAALLEKPERRAVRGAPPEGLLTPTHPTHLAREAGRAIAAHSAGELLAQARKIEHLTLTTLAKRAGLTPGRIAQIESPAAQLEVRTILKLARALGHGVRLSLVPPEPGGQPLVAELLRPNPQASEAT